LNKKVDAEEVIGFEETTSVDKSEIEKLREENKRLKRTLLERFDETFN